MTAPTTAVGSKNLLDVLTTDREMPEGCDTWAVRTIRPDFRSSHDYRYPFPGTWAEAPGPILDHRGNCPQEPGDGICAASTWKGMASAGVPANVLLLVAYNSDDVLGTGGGDKVRLRRLFVVDVVDGGRLLAENGSSADLRYANLSSADLSYANLRSANLRSANLRSADLRYANLSSADLSSADLSYANLRSANLSSADLSYANLSYANLRSANLRYANLSSADLRYANLSSADRANLAAQGWTVRSDGLVVPS